MLKVMTRTILAFAFSVFGKTFIAFAIAMLLCLATALLIDLRLYLSSGVTGALTLVALVVFIIQYRRQQAAKRERARRQAEEATKRAAAAQARNEKMDKAKSAVSDTVRGMASGAAGVVGAAKAGFVDARDRFPSRRR
jgi:type VI protein secretion system component VasK